MSEYRKTTPDELYFVTLTVAGWVDVFSRKEYKDILVDNLSYCQQKEGLEIFAYVIMTNHLHLIVRRQNKDLGDLLGRFKSYTAKKVLTAIQKNPHESRKNGCFTCLIILLRLITSIATTISGAILIIQRCCIQLR